jgi:hypothetical protein
MAAHAAPQPSRSSAGTGPVGLRPVGDSVERPEALGKPRSRRGTKRRATLTFSDDANEARRAIAQTGKVSIDLETRGLHPHARDDAAIGAIILRSAGKNFILREVPEWWAEVWADADTLKQGTNLKFDLMWSIEYTPGEEGLPVARNIHDLMIRSQLVHDYRTPLGAKKAGRVEQWQPNDLKSILHENLGVKIGKEIQHADVWGLSPEVSVKYADKKFESEAQALDFILEKDLDCDPVLLKQGVDWTGDWSESMVEYMLEDIEYIDAADVVLETRLRSQGQERAAWIEEGCVFAFAWMQYNGVQPDVEGWLRTIQHVDPETGEKSGWIHEQRHLLWHLRKSWPGVDNYNSPAQLVASSERVLGGKLPNTKKATLKQLAPHFPAVQMLLDQRQLATYLKNWGPHFLRDYVCGICGRFHPGWNQIGTETSRPSCSRPNLLQIPRAVEFRRLFVAPPGYSLASLDYSAIEVLTAGVFANCRSLIQACAGGDPHLATAHMIAGDSSFGKSDPRRQSAKIANFGLLFGGGRDGLIAQARDLFDVILSPGEAEKIIASYYRLYPELKYTKNLAYRAMDSKEPRLEVTNAVGFRRYLEGYNRKPTSWLNTWIQSTAQSGMKSAMRYLNEALLTPFIIGQIYDEILFEFPDEFAEEGAERARLCMIQGMRDVLGQAIPVHVDKNIAKFWA